VEDGLFPQKTVYRCPHQNDIRFQTDIQHLFNQTEHSAASDGYWANKQVPPAWRTTFLGRMLLYIVCWLMLRRCNSYVLIGVRIIHFRV
jgi:hypothetical protein